MSFGTAIATGLRKYVTFDGRARRSEFWYFYLFGLIVSIALTTVVTIAMLPALVDLVEYAERYGRIEFSAVEWGQLIVPLLIFSAVMLVISIPLYAAQSRRLHDMGQSGLWVLLNFAGLSVVPLVMCIMETEAGPNQWGPDPRTAQSA